MALTNLFVDRPCLVPSMFYLMLVGVSVFTFYFGYLMPSLPEGGSRDFLIWDDPIQVNNDKYSLM